MLLLLLLLLLPPLAGLPSSSMPLRRQSSSLWSWSSHRGFATMTQCPRCATALRTVRARVCGARGTPVRPFSCCRASFTTLHVGAAVLARPRCGAARQATAHERALRDAVADLQRENSMLQGRVADLQDRLAASVAARERATLELESGLQGWACT
jgi:hypothetical protein